MALEDGVRSLRDKYKAWSAPLDEDPDYYEGSREEGEALAWHTFALELDAVLAEAETGNTGWFHQCHRGERWVPLGLQCAICQAVPPEKGQEDEGTEPAQ